MHEVDFLKEAYENGFIKINGREYHFDKMNHHNRLKVFAFFSGVQDHIQRSDFSFLDTKEWQDIDKVIAKYVLFDDMQLSTIKDHWDTYPEDFLEYVGMSLAVISFPFLKGSISG